MLTALGRGTFRELPFEKECGEDNICRDHLRVRLDIVGAQFIVVGSYSTLTLEVTLLNADENSYFTVVTYRVPTGLTFRKTSIISSKRRAHIECDDSKNSKYAAVGIVTCDVNHPIFRSNSTIRFNTTFDVASDVEWKSSEEISINATSDNDQRNTMGSFVARRIGVKYEVNVIIKGIESTQYINFSTGNAGEKPVQHVYRVENIGLQSLPVNVTFAIPVKIGPGMSWEQVIVNTSEGNEQDRVLTPESGQTVDWHRLMPSNNSQVCNISTCQVFVYQLQQLKHRSSMVFSLTGLVKWTKPDQVRAQELSLTSYAAVIYNTDKYIHVSQATNQFQQSMVTTSVEIVEEFNSLPIIVGSSIGGLVLLALAAGILYKVGFFNRSYKDKLLEDAGDDGPGGVPAEQLAPDTATA
ncbi:integrin alpha-M-like [Hemiscyllium ocellatum]|uniref:integrin alpha-M-like n=1 Tax=Hemiscyllium ocellatum TaxID=170820 RepID=UPI002966F4A7|nr:integrin alpha-M-like [Hemiscyllium ocellatum]